MMWIKSLDFKNFLHGNCKYEYLGHIYDWKRLNKCFWAKYYFFYEKRRAFENLAFFTSCPSVLAVDMPLVKIWFDFTFVCIRAANMNVFDEFSDGRDWRNRLQENLNFLKFSFYKISFYSGFSLDRFHWTWNYFRKQDVTDTGEM